MASSINWLLLLWKYSMANKGNEILERGLTYALEDQDSQNLKRGPGWHYKNTELLTCNEDKAKIFCRGIHSTKRVWLINGLWKGLLG